MPRKRRTPKQYFSFTGRFKPGVSSSTYKNSQAFAASRKAAELFGQAAQASKVIRDTLAPVLEEIPQKIMHNRLSHIIGKMIREQLSEESTLHLNTLSWRMLYGFEFNDQKSLRLLLTEPYYISFDRKKDKVFIEIDNFHASPAIRSFKETTHVRILAAIATIDFEKGNKEIDYTASNHLAVQNGKSINISLSLDCSIKTINPIFIILGIACFQELNKKMYELVNQRIQAAQIIEVLHEPNMMHLVPKKKSKQPTRRSKKKKKP